MRSSKGTKVIDESAIRFIIVGIINTLFGTTIMFLCYNLLHLNYWISSAANYFFGSILSFFLNKYFTFRSKSRSAVEVIRFAANICACYFIAYGLAKPLAAAILKNADKVVQENVAMVMGMVVFVIVNYFGQRFFVFKYESNK